MSLKPLEQLSFPFERERIIAKIEEHWNEPFNFRDSLVGLFRVGSHSHGTHIPPEDPEGVDDEDFMAVVVPPIENVIGLDKFEHTGVKKGTLDCVVYEWGKYVRMLLKANPNVVGTLWLKSDDYFITDESWIRLYFQRDLLSSQLAYNSFIGYARGQLHRMTHNAHEGYMGEKRKQLVAKYGYDTKNAAHLIRLMRMAIEFIETGEMSVFRKDAELLKTIKRGHWPLHTIQEEADHLFAAAEAAMKSTPLPLLPEYKKVEEIMIESYQLKWRKEQHNRNWEYE